MTKTLEDVRNLAEAIRAEIAKAIVGQEETIEHLLVALVSQGHVLLEGAPGTAKTFLAQCFARTLGLHFGRIQFTPDLLPGDILGSNLFNFQTSQFTLTRGPIFCELLLADEINRTPPKTQAALLEAMEERQVTIDGETHILEQPFMVLATQNPIEYEGTFPLPEAQLDRFLLRLRLGYPDPQHELAVLDSQQRAHPIDSLGQVVSKEELLGAQAAIREMYVDVLVKTYIIEVVTRTRKHADVYLGASPRGSLTLFRSAQARAALEGRTYVIPDDIKALAPFALAHRMIVSPSARIKDVDAESIVRDILASVPVPGGSVKPN
jgi:MoxR-like ATPase